MDMTQAFKSINQLIYNRKSNEELGHTHIYAFFKPVLEKEDVLSVANNTKDAAGVHTTVVEPLK